MSYAHLGNLSGKKNDGFPADTQLWINVKKLLLGSSIDSMSYYFLMTARIEGFPADLQILINDETTLAQF